MRKLSKIMPKVDRKALKKYISVFTISFQQEFAYRVNFIMWRVRNVMQFFLIFFLWDTIFATPGVNVFGYTKAKILTYVFSLILIRSLVLSTRSVDIAPEIARGDVSNLLLKPINYFKYWLTRDIASKVLNLSFAIFEAGILFILLKPPFYFQGNILYILFFIVSITAAIILYFLLVLLFSMPTFWFPQQSWGFMFLLLVFVDILAGGVFPLDILPVGIQKIALLTPFPYLLFIPTEIYLGQLNYSSILGFLAVSMIWIFVLVYINQKVWNSGLRAYRAEGR